ncbi:MAG: NADH-quinone oxidoreductase subunit J [Prevotellaceae bacterium]|nr:NADH-quinone oxidoreductase subunit J [Prevotellaceae bacterium]
MADIIMFGILACVVLAAAVYSVCTKYIMRAATALIFVLFGVAGLYFVLDYTYLGAVQLSIYAGAISMIYIFAIQLVGKRNLQGLTEQFKGSRVATGVALTLVGLVTVVGILLKNGFFYAAELQGNRELDMEAFGNALMGADKYQYVLPFEFISVFLLACIIGGLLVARDNKEEEK